MVQMLNEGRSQAVPSNMQIQVVQRPVETYIHSTSNVLDEIHSESECSDKHEPASELYEGVEKIEQRLHSEYLC